jgi:signal transduction histidine kinase
MNGDLSLRALICAPVGRDARLVEQMLCAHDLEAEVVENLDEMAGEIQAGAGVVVLSEEALTRGTDRMREAVDAQPAWSDLPIIILTTGSEGETARTWQLIGSLGPVGNVSLLERPLRSMTLVRAVQVALRSRARQYEAKALYEDLERRVVERTAELRRLNAEAEGFSYTIAHDLRSPLRAIVSTSHILLEDHADEVSAEAAAQLRRQAAAAKRLANLIDDLLRLSKLSREEMRRDDVDFTALAHDVVAELGEAREGIRFEVQPGMRASGDPLLLRLALLNLVENACKFSPDGGIVRIGCEGDTFFISDEGIGFNPAYSKQIFLPFERLVEQDRFPGTGIGLANVKRIVERHGGKVWAESAPGKGATFYFKLSR